MLIIIDCLHAIINSINSTPL